MDGGNVDWHDFEGIKENASVICLGPNWEREGET